MESYSNLILNHFYIKGKHCRFIDVLRTYCILLDFHCSVEHARKKFTIPKGTNFEMAMSC